MRAIRLPAFVRKTDPGLLAALGSSIIWGALPLYWNLLRDVSPYLILCHRILWSCAFLLPLVLFSRRTGEVLQAAGSSKARRVLFCSSMILGVNWLVFIWAVINGRVLETSLGYYINPLITICMGVLLFRDRPSRAQMIAVCIAGAGVSGEVVISGVVPWVSLVLAVLFAAYALLRKLAPVESLPGLMLETLMLCPFALAYIFWSAGNGVAAWGENVQTFLLLAGTGAVTSTPLILYAYGARHISFTTLGILHYIAPTCSFLIGVFVFEETFTVGRAVSFIAIWTALAIYTADSLRSFALRSKKMRAESVSPKQADGSLS